MSHTKRGAALLVLIASLATLSAADPKLATDPADPKGFDKLIVDTLRDVHNKGADLYNTTKDFAGAYRIYEGSLRTIRPLLAYRPAAQKLIDDGLATSDKEADAARRAFLLHETIEKVRAYLKTTSTPDVGTVLPPKVEPKPVPTPMPTPKEKTPNVETKPRPETSENPSGAKPTPPLTETKPLPAGGTKDVSKPTPTGKDNVSGTKPMGPDSAPKVEPKTTPKSTTPKSGNTASSNPIASNTQSPSNPMAQPANTAGGVSGRVTLGGKPVAKSDVLLVSLTQPKPRVFHVVTKDDGSYVVVQEMPAGKYVVLVTGKDVPAKFSTTTTSGLTIDVKPGSKADLVLK